MPVYGFPKWLKRFYRGAIWDFFLEPDEPPALYLTFDDGPNPGTTEWILSLLDQYQAKATFFCLGKNVVAQPERYHLLHEKGHLTANHGYHHLKGWKTPSKTYFADIEQAAQFISSAYFRPPYGKIKASQHHALRKKGFQTVFWSHISYDFAAEIPSETRLTAARKATRNGAIFVFHDSDKAFPQLQKELPVLMQEWQSMGYQFKTLPPLPHRNNA